VVEVRLETAGGNEPEARLQVLSLKAMEEMRQHIRREKGQPALAEEVLDEDSALAMEEAPQAQQSRTLLHLPWRELVVHGIIENRGLVVVGAAMGLAYELGLFGGDDKPFWSVNVQAQAIRDLVSDFTGTGILIAALGLLFVVLLRLFSVGLAIVKLYGFRLQKSGRDLTLTGGLFTRFTTTIPLHRIQILTVREKPLQRLFKRAEVRAQTVGNTDESKESVLGSQHLAPLIHRRQLPQLLKEVQPEIDLEAIQWQSVAPKAKRRIRRKGYFVVALISAAGSFYLGWWALMLLAALVPLAVVNARLQMKHLGYAEHGGVLLFRSGWMWRNLSMARTSKIQAVTMSQSPFDRRYRMSRLRVDTAGAGQTGHILEIPYLDWDVARSLYNSLGADAAHTAFRW
ncbi:MAG: PH domain-containing protein, partial [Acidobacteriota bacterium]